MSVDRLPAKIGSHSTLKDFLHLNTSRDDKSPRGYCDSKWQKYVLVGWTKEGEPIFVDNGQSNNVWDDFAHDNTASGATVGQRVYWRVDQSSGGKGRLLPPYVRINPKNLWLELNSCIPADNLR